MPELPEITAYVEALQARIVGHTLDGIRIRSPSLLRTFDPPISFAVGRKVSNVTRMGKRIVWGLDRDLFLVFHLMITGRFHRKAPATPLPKKRVNAAFDFTDASYFLSEQGKRKRASLHLIRGQVGVLALDPGGLEPTDASGEAFAQALRAENRTLKRALTDPRILSGIGNAHSDEILHAAQLSPVQLTRNLTDAEMERLRLATVENIAIWTEKLRSEAAGRFPERITAFHEDMAVHGRFGKPCPVCGDPVQRIVYAERETNYCATCQTGGRLLRDRALSRLLNSDWPRTLEDKEEGMDWRRIGAESG